MEAESSMEYETGREARYSYWTVVKHGFLVTEAK